MTADVAVIGAGHNGLVAAALLARAGLRVVVLETAGTVGGAARTERPFAKTPGLGQSTGAYLLGLMPPELMTQLDLRVPVLRRDPHYVLPALDGTYLMRGERHQADLISTDRDRAAEQQMWDELAALRDDLAPAWLASPLSLADTAERYVRAPLREVFVDLCRGSVADYLDRFDFETDLIKAMYVVTDGLSGLHAGPDTPGSGHNFLVHNMCRLPGSGGTWMVVAGGMGTVTRLLAEKVRAAGGEIRTGAAVTGVLVDNGAATGVTLADGTTVLARAVLACCDPFRLAELTGGALPADVASRIEGLRRDGTTLKVNMALDRLPRLRCLDGVVGGPGDAAYGATIHLLPQTSPMTDLREMWAAVQRGELPDRPTIEWYIHTAVDPTLQDDGGHHSSALFVQSVPYQPAGSSWDAELDGYVARLLAICDEFAPGTSASVVDTFPLTPPGIEAHFGITRGHIHHVDNTISFADRMPYETGVDGLFAGGAGCHPAGSVIGAAGHNAAMALMKAMAVRLA